MMPDTRSLTTAQFEELKSRHGPIIRVGSKEPTDPKQRALDKVSGRFTQPYQTQFTFKDGTSVTLTWSQEGGVWIVDDWGTLGEDEDAKNPSAANQLDTEYKQLRNDEMRRKAAETQQRTIGEAEAQERQYDEAVTYLQQQLAQNKISREEANARMARVRRNFELAQVAKEQATKLDRQQVGTSYFNQRQASGATNLGTSADIWKNLYQNMLPYEGMPESVYDFDPYAQAKNYTTDMGGGQEVTDQMKQLILGATDPNWMPPQTPEEMDRGVNDIEMDAIEAQGPRDPYLTGGMMPNPGAPNPAAASPIFTGMDPTRPLPNPSDPTAPAGPSFGAGDPARPLPNPSPYTTWQPSTTGPLPNPTQQTSPWDILARYLGTNPLRGGY